MEKRQIKRLPVVRGNEVVGIVSRANLVHALAGIAREVKPAAARVTRASATGSSPSSQVEPWAPTALINVIVKDGIVELWGRSPTSGSARPSWSPPRMRPV